MVTSVTKGGTQNLPKKLEIAETYADMTIHWNFLMVALVLSIQPFLGGKMHFLNFSQKKLSP
jgi:hypothetical protein